MYSMTSHFPPLRSPRKDNIMYVFVTILLIIAAQDFVPSEFEARVYVVRGVIAHIIYSNFGRVDPDGDYGIMML